MKRPTPQSSGSKVVVGDKPLWQLWADSVTHPVARGQQLLDAGAFTTRDFADRKGWTESQAKHYLNAARLESEYAQDPRLFRRQSRRFFMPPGKKLPPK